MDAIPYAPTTLTYQNVNGHPKLIWSKSKSKDVAGYKVYRGNLIATTNSPNDTTYTDTDVSLSQSGLNITYYIKAFDSHAPSQLSNPSPNLVVTGWYMKVSSDVSSHNPVLFQNSPNPFNPSTEISFQLPELSSVSLLLFDLQGRELAVLVRNTLTPGTYSFIWNGRSDAGESVSSGVYLARLVIQDELGSVRYSKINKLVLLK